MSFTLDELMSRAWYFYQNGQYESSLNILTQLSNYDRENVKVWFLLALCYRKCSELNGSDIAFRKAISLSGNDPDIYSEYANLLVELNNFRDAEINYKSAIKINPKNHIYHYNLGLIYFRQNKIEMAIIEFERTLDCKADFRKALDILVQCLALSGKKNENLRAKKLLENILEKDVFDRMALKMWADLSWLENDKSWDCYYAKACRNNLKDVFILSDYVKKLISSDNLIKAKKLLDGVDFGFGAGLLALKAHLYYCLGCARESLGFLNEIHDVSNQDIKRLRTKVLLANGEPDKALQFAYELVGEGATQGDWALLASSYKRSGQYENYRKIYDFDDFIKVFPIDVPDGFSTIESFNQKLAQELFSRDLNENHPIEQSLRNGLQTSGHLFLNCTNMLKLLEGRLKEAVKSFVNNLPDDVSHPFLSRKSADFLFSGAWSVRLNSQGFHHNHFHNDGWISGCYYVSLPSSINENGQGWIKFGQIESERTIIDSPDYYLKPEAGCVVFFPSFMWHGTMPFDSDEFRLTVAFDLIPKN